MKKVSLSLIIGVSAIASIISCKHEIPDGGTNTGAGPGNGPGPVNPPVVNCSQDTVYFQQQVLPIFISNCSLSGCHDAASHREGVVLTDYNNIMVTGEIDPGDPGDSEIWEKITESDPDDRMPPPPRNPLTQQQKEMIRKWIMQGAKNNSCVSSACDTGNVTYSGAIRSIITAKCQGCHSSSAPSGGYDFTSYTVLKARVDDGKLWGAVNHMPGYSAMPKNGAKLSACELAQIKKWMDEGAPNN